MLTEDVG